MVAAVVAFDVFVAVFVVCFVFSESADFFVSPAALAEVFQCGVNELPLTLVLSWYEQKAVCILLTLLHLGIRNIYLGPSLPAFVSPNVLNFLVENYQLTPISTPEEDLKKILSPQA